MGKRIAVVLVIGGAVLSASATAGLNGKLLFDHYRCSACHGESGRGSASVPAARPIAGMEKQAVVDAIHQSIASGKHEDYADPGCGEPPSTAQIQAIADYVSRQSVK